MALFARKTLHDSLKEIEDNVYFIQKVYARTEIKPKLINDLWSDIDYFQKNSLPLSRKILEQANRINTLIKSATTSFHKIISDPAFDPNLPGNRLTLVQLNNYLRLLTEIREELKRILIILDREKFDVQGNYAAIDKVNDRLAGLKENLNRAKENDLALHKTFIKMNLALEQLEQRFYP